ANSSFLDVFLKVYPADDFCGAQRCNISYAISVLLSPNQFDLQSVMLQEGRVARNDRLFFEENTIVRLNKNLENATQKVYIGIRLFDVPDDMQNYFIVEVTDTIQKKRRTKVEFSSDTIRVLINIHKKKESTLISEAWKFLELEENAEPNSCSCVTRNCGCCEHMVVKKIHLDDNVCVNISYISEDIGMKVSLSVNNRVYY
uniref:DUF4773 domain-containing protein n=1 Tax=Acrobeloides nanus TaxID=290746 RepID=A0A914D3X8_9BILA